MKHAVGNCEWVVIDNNSDEETKNTLLALAEFSQSLGHTFILVTENSNTGVAKAWNTGLSKATGHFICILNNDCVMQPGWDTALQEQASLGKLDLFSPFVLEPGDFHEPYTLERFLDLKHWEFVAERNKYRYRCSFFSGIVIYAKKEVFETVGKFDEQFWLSLEDMDYEYRAWLKGFKPGICGGVTAFHFVSATRSTMNMNEATNQELFEQKWGWNFTKYENTFWNKRRRSYRKRLLKLRALLSTSAGPFPKNLTSKN